MRRNLIKNTKVAIIAKIPLYTRNATPSCGMSKKVDTTKYML